MDPGLYTRALRMSVQLCNGVPNSLEQFRNALTGGTGGVFHVMRSPAERVQYIVTNEHNIRTAIPGTPPDTSLYAVFYDHLGRPGIARIVSTSARARTPDDGRLIGYDHALLQVLDVHRDRQTIREVLERINPQERVRWEQGTLQVDAGPESIPLQSIEAFHTHARPGRMPFFAVGYPMGSVLRAAMNRAGKLNSQIDRKQLEVLAGSAFAADGLQFHLFPERGESRIGYSGTVILHAGNGLPMGILFSGLENDDKSIVIAARKLYPQYNGTEIALASSLYPAAQEIRRIEALQAQGLQSIVSPASPLPDAGYISHTVAPLPGVLRPRVLPGEAMHFVIEDDTASPPAARPPAAKPQGRAR